MALSIIGLVPRLAQRTVGACPGKSSENGAAADAGATLAARARSKRGVKNWLALICTIPIRSLRTKWSRMENKAVVLLFACLGDVSATIALARQRRARIHGEENRQACIATHDPGDRHRRLAREVHDRQGANPTRVCVRS